MSCKVHTLVDQVCVFWSIVVYGKMGQINFGAVLEIKCRAFFGYYAMKVELGLTITAIL